MIIFSIFVPGDVPSSKNSKVWTGKFLVSSKTATRYKNITKGIWDNPILRDKFLDSLKEVTKPYRLSFKFIRGTRRIFDYVNMTQMPLDLMVAFGWLEDDNANEVKPEYEQYEFNKTSPGVIISIIK